MTKHALWNPTTHQVHSSRLADFITYVNNRYSLILKLEDYQTFHQWSITHREDFWRACWEFLKIEHTQSYDCILKPANHLKNEQWFPGSKLNFAQNLLQAAYTHPDKIAISEWNEKGHVIEISFAQLLKKSQSLAQVFKTKGLTKGDRIAACLPNASEAVISMLATASIGAVWSSCSPDFGAQGMLDRFEQIAPKAFICCHTYQYNGKLIDVSTNIKALIQKLPSVELLVIVEDKFDSLDPVITFSEKQLLFSDCVSRHIDNVNFEQVEFNHPLYIMFSSGTTGLPKCIVHGTGGTLLQHLKEHQLHSDLREQDKIFFFTTCGWMMWNWLVSALASNTCIVVYDGSPFYPNSETLFNIAEQEQLSHFGVGAKFISAIEKQHFSPKTKFKLPKLRVMLSTGSPLSAKSFEYVYEHIKQDLLLASISGGTDIISCFALGNPCLPVHAGEIQCKGLGMDIDVFDETGNSLVQQKGELVCKQGFPSMPVGFWNDVSGEQYFKAYFSTFPNIWAHGDYAELTNAHGLIIHGRSDAILNPGGVRIGTAEIYRQVETVDEVLESVVIGQNWHDDTRVILFVVLKPNIQLDEPLTQKIKSVIRSNTTPRHVPTLIIQVNDIPRTKSGKIVEIAVRDIMNGNEIKNTEALANPESLENFKKIRSQQLE